MKKDFEKFTSSIEKLDLITGGATNQNAAVAQDCGYSTENCKGTVEMSSVFGPTDYDSEKFGDWYSDC
ncbi:hypothetical protein [Aureispira sp. CCB-QB1]|uniref:hypothetical protein n=1 Tax=Aureispira sp. CCB-QB1 TaxID=1313421 RepID=UPI0006972A77|nr:hypothetical protein [Aureispira sp. CCB-QB1]